MYDTPNNNLYIYGVPYSNLQQDNVVLTQKIKRKRRLKTMGLDMSLFKKYYIGSAYEWNNVSGNIEIVYWRKANMIHKWFVDHCQDGEDDCKPYYVSSEQLCELLNACLKIKSNPELAREILPTQEGFFFGGTDYDDFYFSDIEDTIKKLSMLNLMGEDYSFDYYYQSSW